MNFLLGLFFGGGVGAMRLSYFRTHQSYKQLTPFIWILEQEVVSKFQPQS